jgi:hypothetical protein
LKEPRSAGVNWGRTVRFDAISETSRSDRDAANPARGSLTACRRHGRRNASEDPDPPRARHAGRNEDPARAEPAPHGRCRICLSNNAAERALRGIAVGRHNWTFAGFDRGGERAILRAPLDVLQWLAVRQAAAHYMGVIDPRCAPWRCAGTAFDGPSSSFCPEILIA